MKNANMQFTQSVLICQLCGEMEMICKIKWHIFVWLTWLIPKHRETHGCIVSTVATDALVLKHQAISIHNAD